MYGFRAFTPSIGDIPFPPLGFYVFTFCHTKRIYSK